MEIKEDAMGRRSNGEGCIYKRKDGRWVGKYSVNGKRKSVYGRTRKEVAAKLTKALSEIAGGLLFDSLNLTLEEHLEKWLKNSVRDSVRQRTYDRYEQLVRVHINPTIGRVKLKNLTPAHVQGLYREKLDSGLSPRTVQYIHVTLHKGLKQAMRWGLVPRNITEAVDPPRASKKEIRPLTEKQVKVFLQTARGDRLEALYLLALTSGLRQGELLGLKWEDIDFDQKVLQVKRTLSITKKGPMFVPPKSAKSRRSVALTTYTVETLKRHKAAQDDEKMNLQTSWNDHGLVFPNQSGDFIHPWILTKGLLKKMLKKAGLPSIRFHDLRHTCATLLLTKGVHPKIVQELLGHSTISITLDIYSHVLPNMQKEVVKAMEDLLDQ
jgi:integrase